MDSKDSFIQILGDYLTGEKRKYILTDEICYLAKIHQVEGILYKQTNDERYKSSYYFTIVSYFKRNELEKQIHEHLLKHQIDHFFVKGMSIAEYYPDPFLRTMGDTDIIVHKSDKIMAANLMIEEGFSQRGGDRFFPGEWHLWKNGCLFELHHALLYGSDETSETENDDFVEYFSKCWNHVHDNVLENEFHLLYLIVHFRKHLMNKGVGIRQIMDIVVFSKSKINWDLVYNELKSLGLLSFSQKLFGLIKKWWGINTPLAIKVSEPFEELARYDILNAGVFGFENDSGENHIINIERHGRSQLSVKTAFMFPSYSNMSQSEAYSKLRGKPFLLPLFWIYRASKHYKSFNMKMRKFKVDKNAKNKRIAYLKEWDLI